MATPHAQHSASCHILTQALPGSFSGSKGILPQHAGVRRARVPRTLLATDNLKQAQEGDLRLCIILLYKKNKMYQPDLGS